MRSIKRDLTVGLLVGFALLLGAGAVLVYYTVRATLYRQFDSELRGQALSIISVVFQERRDIDVDFSDRYLREFDDDVATHFFQLTRTNGQVVETSDSLDKQRLPQRSGTIETPAFWNLELPNQLPGRAIAFDFVPQANSEHRRYYQPGLLLNLVVAADRRKLDRALSSLRNTLIAASSGAALGGALLVMLLVGRGLKPLHNLSQQAAAIDATRLGHRFSDAKMPVELAPIFRGLNELLARLEQSFERERRFSSDVAHELRTPIAELRSLAEVGLKWPAPQDTTATFNDALAIARQMETIVTALLGMARCESGKQLVRIEPVDLEKAVRDSWKPFHDLSDAKSHDFSLNIASGTVLRTDPAMFSIVLTNLFSNAAHHTPRRGRIHIVLDRDNPSFTLSVINTIEELSPTDVPKMFERFWRKDAARSSSEHSGLGLALARAFAERLGMELEARLVGAELAMSLSGPLAPTS